MYKHRLSLLTIAVLWGICYACDNSQDTTPFSCPEAVMQLVTPAGAASMQVTNNTLFRTPSDTGSHKLLSLEAVNDSFRIIFNVKEGPFNDNSVWEDSMSVREYSYASGRANSPVSGLVVVGTKSGSAYQFADTDTSSITLTRWDIRNQTVSGTYYFEAGNGAITGSGTFSNVCFVSLK